MAKQRGPAPKPTALKKLQGNPGQRKLNESEPQPKLLTDAKCPTQITNEHAKGLWTYLAPKLCAHNLLTEIDLHAFESLCVTYGRWRHFEELVGSEKYPDKGWIAAARNYQLQFYRWCGEFGLTPAARSRLSIMKFSALEGGTVQPGQLSADEEKEFFPS